MLSQLLGPWRWLRARRARRTFNGEGMALLLHGRSDFPFEVVGQSLHANELREIVARRRVAGRYECLARLVLAQGKPYEKTTVAVEIDGAIIGYCPRYLAAKFREWVEQWQFADVTVRCNALIVDTERGRETFAVKLDIELPFKATRL